MYTNTGTGFESSATTRLEFPEVSVVVTTRNSGATLERSLQSVVDQTYQSIGKIEVIVVDNYSKDETCEIARKFKTRLMLAGPERTSQVNVGAVAAKGKYIYWMASDWVLDKSLIEEAVVACEQHGYDAIAIHNISDPTVSFWSKVRKFERDFYASDPLIMTPGFFRRNVYLGVGGYNESLVACEEYELHRRLVKAGYRVGKIRAKELHIGEPKTLREVATKHYYYGKTVVKYMKTDPADSMRRLSPIRIGFLSNWRSFTYDPVLTAGFMVYSLVRYLSVGLGVLVSLA
jgi:glycosyltransferase involved in cell wall biosynthesis